MHANSEIIHKMTRVYRANIIENAYEQSDLHGYSMPRFAEIQSDGESEDIPLIYNLHSQNMAKSNATKIIPIRQLTKYKKERKFSDLRQSNLKLSGNKADSCAKIKRTVNKIQAKEDRKRLSTLLCCDKQQQLEKYQTREISTEREENTKIKIKRISNQKYTSFL